MTVNYQHPANLDFNMPEDLQYKHSYEFEVEEREAWIDKLFTEALVYYPAKALFINYAHDHPSHRVNKLRDTIVNTRGNDKEYFNVW